MKFLCNHCGAPFDEPKYITTKDRDEEGRCEASVYCVCPLCASDNIEGGIGPCDLCGAPKRSDDIVCDLCKRKFLVRLNAFIGELTAPEVELMDQLSDGNSFEDVKKWR